MLAADAMVRTAEGPTEACQVRDGMRLVAWGQQGLVTTPAAEVGYRAAPVELITLTLSSGRELRVTPSHPIYCRFLPGTPRFDVALVKETGLGAFLISGPRGLRELAETGFFYKTVGEGEDRTEEVFLLGSYEETRAATLLRKLMAARFGVPESTGGLKDMGREEWKELFLRVDTLRRAHELLEELELDPDDPHWVQRSLTPGQMRKHLLIDACRRGEDWYVEVRRPERTEGRLLKVEGRPDAEQLKELTSYEGLDHVDVLRRYDLGWPKPYRRMRAAAVQPGMGVPSLRGKTRGEERVVAARRTPGEGLVYKLEAPDTLGILVEGLVLGASEIDSI